MAMPGSENVVLKLPPESIVPESNAPVSEVTVCGAAPLFCQVTVVPTGAENTRG